MSRATIRASIMMKKVRADVKKMRYLKKDVKEDMQKKLDHSINVRLANSYANSAVQLLEKPYTPVTIKNNIAVSVGSETTLSLAIKNATKYNISMGTVLANASLASHKGTMTSMRETNRWFFANPTAKAKFEAMKRNHERFDYEKDNENVDIVDVNSITLPSALKIIQSYIDKLVNFVLMMK